MPDDAIANLEFKDAGVVVPGRPWPRYFARMLDVLLISMVAMFVGVIVFMIIDQAAAERFVTSLDGIGGTIVTNILSHAVALVPIVLLLSFGQTPGKWLMGIRVRRRDGRRMTLPTALKRELRVWMRGLGFALPVVSLYTLAMSHGDLKNEGITPWDKSLDLDVQHAPVTVWWWIRATLGGAIVVAATFWGIVENVLSIGR